MQKLKPLTMLLVMLAASMIQTVVAQEVATPLYTSETCVYQVDEWPAHMGEYSDGYVLVRVKNCTLNDPKSYFKIYDARGKETGEFSCVTDPSYVMGEKCPKFRNGTVPIHIKEGMDNYMALVDMHGRVIKSIPIHETSVDYEFSREGFITCQRQLQGRDGSKHRVLCYYDTQGNEVFQNMWQVFDEVYERRKPMRNFCDDLCCYYDYKTELYGYFNRAGQIVIPAKYKMAHDFSEGKAVVSPDGKMWGFIDKQDKLCFDRVYEHGEPSDFHEGYAVIPQKTTTGDKVFSFIDAQGNAKAHCESANSFFHGYAWVTTLEDHKHVVVNKQFEIVGDQPFALGVLFYHDAQGVIENQHKLYKPDGTWCFNPREVELIGQFSDGFVPYTCPESYGFIGVDGKVNMKFVMSTSKNSQQQ